MESRAAEPFLLGRGKKAAEGSPWCGQGARSIPRALLWHPPRWQRWQRGPWEQNRKVWVTQRFLAWEQWSQVSTAGGEPVGRDPLGQLGTRGWEHPWEARGLGTGPPGSDGSCRGESRSCSSSWSRGREEKGFAKPSHCRWAQQAHSPQSTVLCPRVEVLCSHHARATEVPPTCPHCFLGLPVSPFPKAEPPHVALHRAEPTPAALISTPAAPRPPFASPSSCTRFDLPSRGLLLKINVLWTLLPVA